MDIIIEDNLSEENSSVSSSEINDDYFLTLSEDEFEDIVLDIYDQITDFFNNHVIKLSTPTFYDDMYYHIASILYDEWTNYNLFENSILITYENGDELFQEILEFVEQIGELYMDFSNVPMRTIMTPDEVEEEQTIRDKIDKLRNIPQPQQRTKEWYEFRYNLLSASNIYKVFGSESLQNSLIYEKCQPINPTAQSNMSTNTSSSLHWGVKYEPVTVMVYEDMFHTKMEEFGCIQHPLYSFLGASPDGINVDPKSPRYGRMLEIKNIVNREITGIPKEEYWIQTQVQMETCDLDLCDFMETRFLEYASPEDFYNDTDRDYRGVILYFIENDPRSFTVNIPKYKYMPLSLELEKDKIDQWIRQMREESKKDGLILFQTIYWYLEEYSCVLIPRNRQWFSAALPKIDALWKTVLKERVEGYDHRASKKKQTIVTTDISSNSYFINNMSMNRGVCLVKLDY